MKIIERIKNWKNTALAVIPAIVSVLGFTGILHVEQGVLSPIVADFFNGLIEFGTAITAGVLVFKRDAPEE